MVQERQLAIPCDADFFIPFLPNMTKIKIVPKSVIKASALNLTGHFIRSRKSSQNSTVLGLTTMLRGQEKEFGVDSGDIFSWGCEGGGS